MSSRHSPWDAWPSAHRGYTLLELVIVVGLVGLLAAAALPQMQPADDERLGAAAAWTAEMLRFARAEAVRTSSPVYVEIDRATGRLLVARANLSGTTAVAGATLREPTTKQPLDVVLSSAPPTAGTKIVEWPFAYASGGRQASVVFDAQGVPFRKLNGTFEALRLGEIRLARGGRERTVLVERVTGLVRVL